IRSPPAWGRGLKRFQQSHPDPLRKVAPRVGAWIGFIKGKNNESLELFFRTSRGSVLNPRFFINPRFSPYPQERFFPAAYLGAYFI
ncbi:hypothetical protein JW926_07485, partial [Candidatus Sumerlaeota bacterium]|nr:hypothetical protein [Candidatus Sumerlaeota bacterium]